MKNIINTKPVVGNPHQEIIYYNDGTISRRCYPITCPKYTIDNKGNMHKIDLTEVKSYNKKTVGVFSVREKNVVTEGIRRDSSLNKFVGYRPFDNQKEQMEFSIKSVIFNNDNVIIDISKSERVNNTTTDLGDIIIKSNRNFSKHLFKIKDYIYNFKIEYNIDLTDLKIKNKKKMMDIVVQPATNYTIKDKGHAKFEELEDITPYKKGAPLDLQIFILEDKVISSTIDSPKISQDDVPHDFKLSTLPTKGCSSSLNYKTIGIYMKGRVGYNYSVFKHKLTKILTDLTGSQAIEFGVSGTHLVIDNKVIGFLSFSPDGIYTMVSIQTEDLTQFKDVIPNHVKAESGYVELNYEKFRDDFLKLVDPILGTKEVKYSGEFYEPDEFGNFTVVDNSNKFKFKLSVPKIIDRNFNVISDKLNHLLRENKDGTLTYIKFSNCNTPIVKPGYYIDADIYYSTTSDGYITKSSTTSFSAARDATTGDIIDTSSSTAQVNSNGVNDGKTTTYTVGRLFFYFDTSDVVSAGSGSLNLCYSSDINAPGVEAFTGVQASTLTTSDFDSFTASESWGDYTGTYTGDTYFSIDISDISYINNSGITKCCLRQQDNDVNNATPSGVYSVAVYMADDTGSYDPYLEIIEGGYSKIVNKIPYINISQINKVNRTNILDIL